MEQPIEPRRTLVQRLTFCVVCAAGLGLLAGFWVGAHSLVRNPTIVGFGDGALTVLFFGALLAAVGLPLGLGAGVLCALLRSRSGRFDAALSLGVTGAFFFFVEAWDRSYVCQQLVRARSASLTVTREEALAQHFVVLGFALLFGVVFGVAIHLSLGLLAKRGVRREGPVLAALGALAAALIVGMAVFRPPATFYAPAYSPEMARPSDTRVRLIVVDGADWRLIDPLLERGELPNLRALMDRGVWSELGVTYPSESPHMWTTLSTGLEDDVNGLCEFYAFRPPGTDALITRYPGLGDSRRLLFRQGALVLDRAGLGAVVPASSAQKRVPEIWDYLGDAGKSVAVVGWRYSAPVSEVNGVLVSDEFGADRSSSLFIFPGELAGELRTEFTPEAEAQMTLMAGDVDFSAPLTESRPRIRRIYRTKVNGLRDNLERDLMYVHTALAVEVRHRPDFMAVALRAVDGVEHQGMIEHVLAQHPERPITETLGQFTSREVVERGGGVIDGIYKVFDEHLGALVEDAGDDMILLVSDHGHDLDGSGHRFGPPGIIVMAGGPVGQGNELSSPTVFDVLPTTLHVMGLPVPAGLEGRVLTEAFRPDWLSRNEVVTKFVDAADAKVLDRDVSLEGLDEDALEEMRALGYVDF